MTQRPWEPLQHAVLSRGGDKETLQPRSSIQISRSLTHSMRITFVGVYSARQSPRYTATSARLKSYPARYVLRSGVHPRTRRGPLSSTISPLQKRWGQQNNGTQHVGLHWRTSSTSTDFHPRGRTSFHHQMGLCNRIKGQRRMTEVPTWAPGAHPRWPRAHAHHA